MGDFEGGSREVGLEDPRREPVVSNQWRVQEPMDSVPGRPKKSNLKQFIIFFGIILVILIIISIGFSSGTFFSNKISEKQLIVGASLTMKQDKSMKVEVGEQEHEVEIEDVGDDWIDMVIRSEPLRFRLEINEVVEVDLDNDGVSDLRIKLFEIQNGKAIIAVKRIDKEACVEDWICEGWGNCIEDKRERICKDVNDCRSEFFVPVREQRCVGSAPVEINETLRTVRKISHLNLNASSNVSFNNQTQNQTQLQNQTQSQNQTGVNDTNLCSNGEYFCNESNGYFCRYSTLSNTNYSDIICCSVPCIKFVSEEQFCNVRGKFLFLENETHYCFSGYSYYFNGEEIYCCIVAVKKENTETDDWSDYVETRDFLNCGEDSDYDCFIEASETCHPAKGYVDYTAIMMGDPSASTYLEIKGYSNEGKCLYYHKYSSEEKDDSFQGSEMVCEFNNVSDLTSMFEGWKIHKASTSFYSNAVCRYHTNPECNLAISGGQVAGGSVGWSTTIELEGFSDTNYVFWEIKNESVVSLSNYQGSSSVISFNNMGKTTLLINDSSIEDCFLNLSITTLSPPD